VKVYGQALSERNAAIVAAVRAGGKHAEVARAFAVTSYTVSKVMSVANKAAQPALDDWRARRRLARMAAEAARFEAERHPSPGPWLDAWVALGLPVAVEGRP